MAERACMSVSAISFLFCSAICVSYQAIEPSFGSSFGVFPPIPDCEARFAAFVILDKFRPAASAAVATFIKFCNHSSLFFTKIALYCIAS